MCSARVRRRLLVSVGIQESPTEQSMEILRYRSAHEKALFAAIKKDANWALFTSDGAIDNYRKALKKSITFVCFDKSEFCGYLRALLDDGFAVYISELYVVPECRNRTIGRSLIAQVKKEFDSLTVYALSDEDAYYEKLGFTRIGSVFEVSA